MSKQEKENKKNALVGTIIFHAILVFLLTLPFMSLTYQDPPLPSENGISIDFSSSNSGFTSQSSNQTLKVVENEVVENEVVENEVVENEVVENEVVENEVVENEVVEVDSSLMELLDIAEEKQNDSSKDNDQDNGNSEDDGDDKGDGNGDDKGDGDGDGDGDDEGFLDIQRTPKNFPIPKGNKNETGSVVIRITVDSKGKVILAQIVPSYKFKNKNIISSNDKTLRKNALEAAYNTTFEPKESNEDDDIGYRIFNFKVIKGEKN